MGSATITAEQRPPPLHQWKWKGRAIPCSSSSLLPISRHPKPPPLLAMARLPTLAAAEKFSQAGKVSESEVENADCNTIMEVKGMLIEEEEFEKGEYVEVGIISNTHGVLGELKVISLTDFPEERFAKAGVRWIKTQQMGKSSIRQVELIKGRFTQGKESAWLVTLKGFDSIEKASELVGTKMLVKARNKPALNDDDFYVPDLLGMSVLMQNSCELIGEVVDVYKTGACDLLRVKLITTKNEESGMGQQADSAKPSLTWIPFVKEIVPVVNKDSRCLYIDPPEGLLQLNVPQQDKLKKESSQKANKEKRRLREKISGIKKRVLSIKQQHILEGLAIGEDSQRKALIDQLMGIDFKLYHGALDGSKKNAECLDGDVYALPSLSLPQVHEKWLKDLLNGSRDMGSHSGEDDRMLHWWKQGLNLIGRNKLAVIKLMNSDADTHQNVKLLISNLKVQAEQISSLEKLAEEFSSGERPHILWILAMPDSEDRILKELFENEQYFGLLKDQVWFLKQTNLPYASHQALDGTHKILMESPWKIVTGPAGEGHIFSDLCSSGVLHQLAERNIEYLQIYTSDNSSIMVADPVYIGYTSEQNADIGIRVVAGENEEGHILCLQKKQASKSANSNTSSPDSDCYTVIEEEDLNRGLSSQTDQPNYMEAKVFGRMEMDGGKNYRLAEACNALYSVKFITYLAKFRYHLRYKLKPRKVRYVELRDGQDVEVIPEESNALELSCSIHSSLKFSHPDKLVTDNATYCVKMGEMVEEEFPIIVWTSCAVHVIDLIIEDISKLDWVQGMMVAFESIARLPCWKFVGYENLVAENLLPLSIKHMRVESLGILVLEPPSSIEYEYLTFSGFNSGFASDPFARRKGLIEFQYIEISLHGLQV